jgi:hypothetical protein
MAKVSKKRQRTIVTLAGSGTVLTRLRGHAHGAGRSTWQTLGGARRA